MKKRTSFSVNIEKYYAINLNLNLLRFQKKQKNKRTSTPEYADNKHLQTKAVPRYSPKTNIGLLETGCCEQPMLQSFHLNFNKDRGGGKRRGGGRKTCLPYLAFWRAGHLLITNLTSRDR